MKTLPPTTKPKQSELQSFAEHFHQDFGVLYPSLDEGAKEHFRILNTRSRATLAAELKDLLAKHPGKTKTGMVNTWRRLGAQYLPNGAVLEASLQSWAALLESNHPQPEARANPSGAESEQRLRSHASRPASEA